MVLFSLILACNLNSGQDTSATTVKQGTLERSTAGCASSCSLEEQKISQEDWLQAFDAWSSQEVGVSTPELDILLFHSKYSLQWLGVFGAELDDEHYFFLERELRRNLVDVEMRLVDEFGTMRGVLKSRPFHLKEKQHLPFSETKTLRWLETGGKVKRVGLAHLWSRW